MKPDLTAKSKPLLKPSGRWAIIVALVVALVSSGAILLYILRFQRGSTSSTSPATPAATANAVSALGHLKPEGEVTYLSAPTTLNGVGVNRVAKLLVKEGDRVKTGQVVALLDNYETLQMAHKVALEDVEVARANLAKVQAGAQTGELEAQSATIARLEAELQGQLIAQAKTISRLQAEFNNAQIEHRRYRQLFEDGAISASQLDSKQLLMQTAQEQLNEAKVNRERIKETFQKQIKASQATLDQIAEVRPTDVKAVQAELNRAIANAAKAQADFNLAEVRSPLNGQILKIHTQPGEVVGNQGIVALGQTENMTVIAEVYELDVGKLQIGQSAIITSNALPDELTGTISQIGLQVNSQDIVSTDPTANVDNRTVEVKIRLNPVDSQKVRNLTNLQVNVVIRT